MNSTRSTKTAPSANPSTSNSPTTSPTAASAKPTRKPLMSPEEAKAYADQCAEATLRTMKSLPEGYVPPY